MDRDKFPIPTPGARTFQSVGTSVGFAKREIHKAYHRGDYEAAEQISRGISSEEHHAARLSATKIGGAPGGMTFNREDILCPPNPPAELPGVRPVEVEHKKD
jgi:hypothetical protein